MNQIAQYWRRRPWLSVLLLTALVSRALIPQGFMPGHGGLILCPGYAALPAMNSGPTASDVSDVAISRIDMTGMDVNVRGHPAGGAPHANTSTCPFAAVASVIALVHVALTL